MSLLGTTASLFADLSLGIEALILGGFFVGWRFARRRKTNQHYKIMTSAFLLNVIFVGTYMIRTLLSESSVTFQGPENIRSLVYLPTVIVHGIASLLAFALAGAAVYYGYTRSVEKKRRVFPEPRTRTVHRLLGAITIATWTLAFATGGIVYLLLYVIY